MTAARRYLSFDRKQIVYTPMVEERLAVARRLFKQFDVDKTQEISFENMKRISEEVGDNLTDEELRDVLKRCDIDRDQKCTFEDF